TIAKGANPGAANLGSAVLQPSGDHYSSITSGKISGDLTGDVTVQDDSSHNGGTLNFQFGDHISDVVEGDIEACTIPSGSTLKIAGILSTMHVSP
ncbi:MAG: hypothetical protein ABII12_00470, partial [Planctomycetota bacterium]